jgi:hypothetical protein
MGAAGPLPLAIQPRPDEKRSPTVAGERLKYDKQ